MNEQQISETAGELATEILDIAEQLVGVGQRLNELTEGTWMTGATRELHGLIASIEGIRRKPRESPNFRHENLGSLDIGSREQGGCRTRAIRAFARKEYS